MGSTEEEIINLTQSRKAKLKNIGVMTVDGNGKVYLQENGKKYETFEIALKGGVKW